MSDNKKNGQTQVSGVFSVNLMEDGEIPGVTALLNPKEMAEKAAKSEPVTSLEATRQITMPKKNLGDLGVLFELQFSLVAGHYRFHKEIAYKSGEFLQPWQAELFKKMKFVPDFFEMKAPFHEYTERTHAIIFDALGVNPHLFVQGVRVGDTPTYTLLISNESLTKKKDSIWNLLTESAAALAGAPSDKIELHKAAS